MKTPIVILCGLVVLALVIGGLQYTQHSREERILKAAERIDFRTEFSQPEQSSAPPGAVNMSSRITRLEQALAWFEASSSSSPSFAAAKEKLISPSKQRANESRSSRKMVVRNEESVALSASKNKKKIDFKSSHKLKHLRHKSTADDKKRGSPVDYKTSDINPFEAETEEVENVLLDKILQSINVHDVMNYPAWYFGKMGARGYFEHGPWAARADLNITNDNHCGKSRMEAGPWKKLSSISPIHGRQALVATVSRCAICDFIGPWEKYGSPFLEHGIVLVGGGNENWGMMSESVTNRSVQWGRFENKLKSCGKTIKDFHNFMDDNRILLWVTNQHHARSAIHPKIISLPLGMKNKPDRIYFEGMKKYAKVTKKKLLIINNSGWKHREQVNALVASKFPYLRDRGNAYSVGKKELKKKSKDYYEQLAEAKFVLCPSGMGYDTYRHWEVLLMGSIPVFESSPGWDRTFSKLPVVIVKSFDDITPELLETKYTEFTSNIDRFDFERLKKAYWMDLIFETAVAGSNREVLANHPLDFQGY